LEACFAQVVLNDLMAGLGNRGNVESVGQTWESQRDAAKRSIIARPLPHEICRLCERPIKRRVVQVAVTNRWPKQ
jgi:hypothetical protein